jgi:hypothetical protein
MRSVDDWCKPTAGLELEEIHIVPRYCRYTVSPHATDALYYLPTNSQCLLQSNNQASGWQAGRSAGKYSKVACQTVRVSSVRHLMLRQTQAKDAMSGAHEPPTILLFVHFSGGDFEPRSREVFLSEFSIFLVAFLKISSSDHKWIGGTSMPSPSDWPCAHTG